MYKIRFHLGRGENFMKWQVKHQNVTAYHDPESYQLAMFNAKLRVQLGTSKKIHDGACKTVCAWIECDEYQVLSKSKMKPNATDFYVRFNPRHNPNWQDMHNNIINEEEYSLIVTDDRSLFVVSDYNECSHEVD